MQRSIARLREAINAHDSAAVAECFAEKYRADMRMHPSQSFVGNDHVRQNWGGLLARIPNLHADILRWTSAGDETWSEWEMRGTDTDGHPVLMRGVVISGPAGDGPIEWTHFYLDPVID
jgi:ketosteroid isomerase-like protein